mmetsp:Transcript_72260/g.233547  ORF Transcript_72260/g.233547 Transcript_72260/m.233547 type:complete len:302 (-) Transcript_72260:80-985(-)
MNSCRSGCDSSPLSPLSAVVHDSSMLIESEAISISRIFCEDDTTKTLLGEFCGARVLVVKRKLVSSRVKQRLRLAREVELCGRLQHPNLGKLLGFTVQSMQMVFEHLEGGFLFDLLHNTCEVTLAWDQVQKMAVDIASAMDYLHASNVIFRSLSSLTCALAEPVVSETSPVLVKLTDLHVAVDRDTVAVHCAASAPSALAATAWTAPELLNDGLCTTKVDVYAFGVVLYEIVSRDLPFSELDAASLSRQVTNGCRPDLGLAPRSCPGALLELMASCWADLPASRPPFSKVLHILSQVSGRS